MLEKTATVLFFTTDGSATSTDFMDFQTVPGVNILFDATRNVQLVTVNITNDNAVENTEYFYGNISTNDSAINLVPDAVRVNLLEVPEEDGKCLCISSTLSTDIAVID